MYFVQNVFKISWIFNFKSQITFNSECLENENEFVFEIGYNQIF